MVGVTDLDELASDAVSALLNCAAEAAFAIDRSLTVVGWNPAAQRLLGYAPNEVVGRRCWDVLQAVHSHGEPLCVPGCEGVRCFRRFQTFAVPSCYARRNDGGWVAVSFESVVMSRRAGNSANGSAIAIVFLRDQQQKHDEPSARTLQIFTFGRFGLATGGRGLETEKWQRKQALTLLKVLVAQLGRAVPREVLIDCLWPEADERSGRGRLKVTVYALRRQLRAAGMSRDVVETAGEAYLLRREAVWVDAEAFERSSAEGSAEHGRQRWHAALQSYREARRLYRGDYLVEDVHADWCAEERERLREINLEMLAGTAECHAALGQYAEAVSVCRTLLVEDPCRESIHRALMEYLVRVGQTDAAVAQYRHCRRVLAHELGVEPMPETSLLYRRIIAGEAGAASERAGRIAR